MACPKGYHQHLGAKGMMLACHSISDKHDNPRTQQYHEQAIFQGTGEDEFKTSDKLKNLVQIPEEDKARIQANLKQIKSNLKTLARNPKLYPLLGPAFASYNTGKNLLSRAEEIGSKIQRPEDKKMAESYMDTVTDILDHLPILAKGKDTQSLKDNMDSIESYLKICRKRSEQLAKTIREQKSKKIPEYAQYRAYQDFIKSYETKLKGYQRFLEFKSSNGNIPRVRRTSRPTTDY